MLHSLALLLLAFQQTAAAPSAGDASRLVPAEATIVVRLESVASLLDLVHVFGPLGGEPVASLDAATVLAGLQVPCDASAVDPRRPLFLAIALDPARPAPAMTWVLPIADTRAFHASFDAAEGQVQQASVPGYIGLSTQAGYAASAAPNPLAARLRPGVVSAHADLATLIRMYRPLIDMGLRQLETAVYQDPDPGEQGLDLLPMMEWYAELLTTVVDSAEALDLACERQGDELALVFDFTALAGSELDGWESEQPIDVAPLLARLDTESMYQIALAADPVELWERSGDFFESMFGVYPEPLRSSLQELLDAQETLMELLLPGVALSGDLGPAGVRGVYLLRSARVDEFRARFETLASELAGPGSLFQLQDGRDLELDGLAARGWRVRIDLDVMRGMMEGMQPDAPGVETELQEFEQVMQTIYGHDLHLGLAAGFGGGQLIALVLAGDEQELRDVLLGLATPRAPSPALACGLQRAGGSTPAYAYHFDLGRGLAAFSNLHGAPAFANLPFAFDSWGSIHGRTWTWGLAMNTRELLAFAGSVQGQAGR